MTAQDTFLQQLIAHLGLRPLPHEGGLYAETYQTAETIPAAALPPGFTGAHPFGTAIYYLLTADPDSFSALHRLPGEEVWHFYLGDPLEMTLLFGAGESRQVILGQDVLGGQQVQFVVPRGVWQGTRLLAGGRFALVGTSMAPGYISADYTPAQREDLLAHFPHERERILALTREIRC